MRGILDAKVRHALIDWHAVPGVEMPVCAAGLLSVPEGDARTVSWSGVDSLPLWGALLFLGVHVRLVGHGVLDVDGLGLFGLNTRCRAAATSG